RMLLDILQLTIYGVVIGSIIALGAIGVSLTFGILRFANFAHGDLMTFGAYVAFTIYTILGLPMWLGLPAAMAATVLLAFALDRVVFIRLRRKNPVVLLIGTSIGAASLVGWTVVMFIQVEENAVRLIAGQSLLSSICEMISFLGGKIQEPYVIIHSLLIRTSSSC
ncbi:branched-chain amino acid ABC transporter permease, partial [Limnoraphis robusta CCNP1324]|uniref:branched-chain amino acid ABC transporter permease n=1 Tax=Limnoraphis robusta TaxID=1118279 RepID=UPI002B1FF311